MKILPHLNAEFFFINFQHLQCSMQKVKTKDVCLGPEMTLLFTMHVSGYILPFKLVHLKCEVSCSTGSNRCSNWGCGDERLLQTFITDYSNTFVLP